MLLGASYVGTDGDLTPGIEAYRRAHELLPQNETINLDLARLYAQAGQRDVAMAHVDRVLRWSHGQSLERARALREEIEREAAVSDAKSGAAGS